MEEENFNWAEQYLGIQSNKDIKNSNAFKTLIDNNIDTNELTGHEKETNAGVVQLNYKDEKEKEADSYNYARGLLNFVKDMPEETGKALMLAALNGTDVAANATGVLFNLFTNNDQEMKNAFDRKDEIKFKKRFNSNIKTFSDYLSLKKDKVRAIGEDSETSSKAAEFAAMIFQDTPYAIPIYRALKKNGLFCYCSYLGCYRNCWIFGRDRYWSAHVHCFICNQIFKGRSNQIRTIGKNL